MPIEQLDALCKLMKALIDLPDDLLKSAEVHAAAHQRSLSEVVAEGLRLAIAAAVSVSDSADAKVLFPFIPAREGSPVITPEMVAQAEDDWLIEDALKHGLSARS